MKKFVSILLSLALFVPLLTSFANATEVTPLANTQQNDQAEPFVLPDIIDESEAVENGYVGRADENDTDLYTMIFENEDGSETLRMFSHPVKYVDENGDVQDITTNIERRSDGSFGTADNDIKTTFSRDISNGIKLEYNDISITLMPSFMNDSGNVTRFSGSTVSALNDKSVSYAFGTNTTLEYSLTYTGFKEDIVVKEYTGQTDYYFILNTGGLDLVCEYGSYYLVDDNDEMRATIGDIIVFTADERNNTFGELYATELRDGYYMMNIHLDADYLADSDTLYPIRIDPTIEINYDNNGSAGIQDVTINSNAGSSYTSGSLYVGLRENYGISRTLMKFPTLNYTALSASNVIDAKVEIRDILCGSEAMTVEVHAYMGASWVQSDVSWTTVSPDSYSSVVYDTNSVSYSNGVALETPHRYSFDITDIVKGWINGTYSLTKGIMFKAPDDVETGSTYIYKTFASYNRSSNQPSFTLTYNTNFGIVCSNLEPLEGDAVEVYISNYIASYYTITWASSDTSLAIVASARGSSASILCLKAGTVEISATLTDANGYSVPLHVYLYIHVPDGVYYITNKSTSYYLSVTGAGINNNTNVIQYSSWANWNINYQLAQMWKVIYIGYGYYVIRPMHYNNMTLHYTSGNVDIYNSGTTDSQAVSSSSLWTIERDSDGYIFKVRGSNSRIMQASGSSNGNSVVANSAPTNTNMARWNLTQITNPPAGAYLYDTAKEAFVTTATRAVDVGTTKSLSTLQLSAVACSETNYSQSFTWYSSNNAIATVDSNGAVTGVSTGKATITGRVYRNGAYYYVSYTICVGFPSLFSSLINSNILDTDKLDLTDDGLFLTTTPLSTILGIKGVRYLLIDSGYSNQWSVYDYFDDWYLFAVNDGTSVSYGLYKMREQESDSYDGNDPGVTISFIGLDSTKITNCFNNASDANRYALYQALTKVTGPGSYETDDVITGYFADTSSDGAYLIAEKSVSFYANRVSGNVISASDNLVAIFDEIAEIDELLGNIFLDTDARVAFMEKKADLQRIPNALEAINSAAGATIFDFDNYTITVQNKSNLTLYEKQAILACFTADVTFNSFAAEVEFHADAVNSWQNNIPILGDQWYDAAIRADMAVGEEDESGYYDDYYDLNGELVQAQISEHGEY